MIVRSIIRIIGFSSAIVVNYIVILFVTVNIIYIICIV